MESLNYLVVTFGKFFKGFIVLLVMENPLWKAYQKFDDVVMYGVNKGVKAWNWTTGKTKADLANSLLTIAPIFEASGTMMVDPVMGGVITISALGLSHICQIKNKQYEVLEENALKKGALLNPKNSYEGLNVIGGLMFGVNSVQGISLGHDPTLVIGIGTGVRSSSHYVMRADYFPPGKNVVDRVKDRLADLADSVQDRELTPAMFYGKE